MDITLQDGQRGTIIDESSDDRYTTVRMADGRVLRVERSLIEQRPDGLFLPLNPADLEGSANPALKPDREELVVPVLGEELHVEPEKREIGGVRVNKTVQEHQELVDQPVLRERVDVKRVAINQVVNSMMPVRQMGDTMIIPLVEEVLKIEKQLVLKEEIHITKIRTEDRVQQPVTLRREEAQIERFNERGEAIPVESIPVERASTRPVRGVGAPTKPVRSLREADRIRKNKLIK